MAHTLQATIDGTTTNLSNGDLCYYVGQDGLGLPAVRRLQEQGPQQHGTTDLGFLLGARVFRLFFDVPGETAGNVYDRRKTLLDIFKPGTTDIVLTFRLPNGDVRLIDAHAQGGFSFSTAQRRGFMEKAVIILKASRPWLYAATAEDLTVALGVVAEGWTVTMPVPVLVGASVINSIDTITYLGSWETYPHEIKIEGPITNCVITNNTTDEKLDFTGASLTAGQAWYIDLRYGYKTIEREDTTNAIASLTEDSDLATWHLKPGSNEIQVTGTGASAATEITIAYYNRYIGI